LQDSLISGRIATMICRLYFEGEIVVGTSVSLPADQGHYLRTVMRLGQGDQVTLFNATGGEFRGSVERLSKSDSALHIDAHIDINRELPVRVHIVQAACRSEKIETVLQKATELGAASFQVVRSERSSLKLDGSKREKRLERWRKIAIEASEQSFRTMVPDVQWHDSLEIVNCAGRCFTLHPEGATHWPEIRNEVTAATDITLAIGPEGGWSDRDIERLGKRGFAPLLFGPRIMRTETAAPALLAAIQSLLD